MSAEDPALLTREQLLQLLTELGEILAQRGVEGQLYVVGGAAMALVFDARRVTRDVDAVVPGDQTALWVAAREVADRARHNAVLGVARSPEVYDALMTILEIAHFKIQEGHEDAFMAAYREGRHLLTDLDVCQSVTMARGVESPDTFRLLVVWDSVEAHLEEFRNDAERYGQWRALIGPHFAEPPLVEHYSDVAAD